MQMYIIHPHLQSILCYVEGLIFFLKNVLWVGKGSLIFGELRRYVCRTIIFEKDLKL